MTSKYKAVTTKTMLFGYESDLKLDHYLVVNFPKSAPIRGTNQYLNENGFQRPTLDQAVNEAELCVVEQGRKFQRYAVYAVRLDRLGDIEEFECMSVSEKVAAR